MRAARPKRAQSLRRPRRATRATATPASSAFLLPQLRRHETLLLQEARRLTSVLRCARYPFSEEASVTLSRIEYAKFINSLIRGTCEPYPLSQKFRGFVLSQKA